MDKCKVCGAELKEGEQVCPYCGAEVTSESAKHTWQLSREKAERPNDSPVRFSEFMDKDALCRFALCKRDGLGTEKDEQEAFDIFQKLAYGGHFESMYHLAEMYLSQEQPDLKDAYKWLRVAAENGHEQSKLRLRLMKDEFAPYAAADGTLYVADKSSGNGFAGIVHNALRNVVLINTYHEKARQWDISSGAGFIIEGGYVITNAHVVGTSFDRIEAKFEPSIDERVYNLIPIAVRKDLDIAVLRFQGLEMERISSMEHLKLKAKLPDYGEEVYTIGNPLSIGFSVSRGIVSCPNRDSVSLPGVKEVIQTDMTINHGNSGGALLDFQNNVIGVVTYTLVRSSGGMSMCVPAKYIVEVLNSL